MNRNAVKRRKLLLVFVMDSFCIGKTKRLQQQRLSLHVVAYRERKFGCSFLLIFSFYIVSMCANWFSLWWTHSFPLEAHGWLTLWSWSARCISLAGLMLELAIIWANHSDLKKDNGNGVWEANHSIWLLFLPIFVCNNWKYASWR